MAYFGVIYFCYYGGHGGGQNYFHWRHQSWNPNAVASRSRTDFVFCGLEGLPNIGVLVLGDSVSGDLQECIAAVIGIPLPKLSCNTIFGE